MKLTILSLLFLITTQIASATDVFKIKNDLLFARNEFQELAIDLPFARLNYEWRERVRERYKEAGRNLQSASALLERDIKQATVKVDFSLEAFREMGLLLPFSEVATEKIDQVMSRYLKAEDMLRSSLVNLLSGPTDPIKSEIVWRFGKLAWIALDKTLTAVEAETECQKVQQPDTREWRLPTVKEIALAYPSLIDPQSNPYFGRKAAQFAQVWAWDRNMKGDFNYYVDFQTKETGLSDFGKYFSVICIADNLK